MQQKLIHADPGSKDQGGNLGYVSQEEHLYKNLIKLFLLLKKIYYNGAGKNSVWTSL